MNNFNAFTSYLSGVLHADSLRFMALRFLFSEISEDYILGMVGYRVSSLDELELEFESGSIGAEEPKPQSIWEDSPVALCIRRGAPIDMQKDGMRFTYIPLLHREASLGAIVLIGDAGTELPAEFSWMIASMSVAGGSILWEQTHSTHGVRRSPLVANGTSSRSGKLSHRQLRVLALMSEGKTNDQIARQLHVSNSTVRHETMRIFRHLAVSDRTSAAIQAKALGLIGDQGDLSGDEGEYPSLASFQD